LIIAEFPLKKPELCLAGVTSTKIKATGSVEKRQGIGTKHTMIIREDIESVQE